LIIFKADRHSRVLVGARPADGRFVPRSGRVADEYLTTTSAKPILLYWASLPSCCGRTRPHYQERASQQANSAPPSVTLPPQSFTVINAPMEAVA
jgi:hypothetical protein